ncbi:unnamed protein product [Rhizoctonia solani]|uniref:BTB domain-containing protein n=1 Tax=Rhizoctonia solani TaxID=456999 RepID=A0A8H3DUA0_9AGAM|nr:unnamed protein product [Rhizoctonia solani]
MYPFNASNLNNSRPTYIKAEPTDHNYPRDPKYYYPDGNAVFLVEGILFKLHASLVLGVDLGRTRTSEGHTQRYPTEATNLPDEVTDSSDTSPIAILNVTSLQFHRFLFTVFGLPSDPEYLAFLTDPRDPKKHNRDL